MQVSKLGIVAGVVALLVSAASASAVLPAPVYVGAQVTGIWPNSPAMRAGLEVGDVIVAVNNRPVRSMQEYLTRMACGPQVSVLVRDVRSGQYVTRFAVPVNGKLGIRLAIVPVPPNMPATVVQPVIQPVVVVPFNANQQQQQQP
ncbi:MAG: PDZ domain-containing protein [Gemmataceae bacterium]